MMSTNEGFGDDETPVERAEPGDGSQGRYGQLTYSSYDGGGSAGWQVKEVQHLSATELAFLRSRIDAQLDAGVELPRFPSPDDLSSFPRRLVFAGDLARNMPSGRDGRAAAWWHHASAGMDASGRPGNVFIHALLDRNADLLGHAARGSWRPIDWWRSPDWLTPYGPEIVRESTTRPDPPQPGDAVAARAVVDFLLAPEFDRRGVLALLLDACAAALSGGRPVVLATQSTDTAALWIGAISHLTSTSVAASIGFSTLERPASLDSRLRQGLHLSCVPLADAERMRTAGRPYVLISEDERVDTGDLGGRPHATMAGDEVAVTEWSILAKVVLIDHPHAISALRAIDDLSARFLATADDPAWPLAMVCAQQTTDHPFADGSSEAARVLVRSSPDELTGADLVTAHGLVEKQLSTSAAGAWRVLEGVATGTRPLTELAAAVLRGYILLAVADLDWMAQSDGPPLPSAPPPTDWPIDDVEAVVRSTLDRLADLEENDRGGARAAVGLASVVAWLGALPPAVVERLQDELARLLGSALRDSAAQEFIASMGRVAEPTLSELVRPAISGAMPGWEQPLGRQLPRAVLDWLYPDEPVPILPQAPGSRFDFDLCVELAFQRVVAAPSTYAPDRPLAVAAALEFGLDHELLRPLLTEPPWTVDELAEMEQRSSHLDPSRRVPLRYFGPALKSAGSSTSLQKLCQLLLGRDPNPVHEPSWVADLAKMRVMTGGTWWQGADSPWQECLRTLLAGGVAGLRVPDVPFHADAVEALQAAMVLASVAGVQVDRVDQLVRKGAVLGGTATVPTCTMVLSATRTMSVAHVAVAAMLGEPRFPERSLGHQVNQWAHTVEIDTDNGSTPLLRHCVALEAQGGWTPYDQLLAASVSSFWNLLAGNENRERAFRSCEKFASGWLRPLYPSDGLLSRLRGTS